MPSENDRYHEKGKEQQENHTEDHHSVASVDQFQGSHLI